MLSRDREARDDEARRLMFATLALLVKETIPGDRIGRDDLIRALSACAQSAGPQQRSDLESVLQAVSRYDLSGEGY
jgi:hypothetical protein